MSEYFDELSTGFVEGIKDKIRKKDKK